MATKNPKRLVIDTCVLASAGPGVTPLATRCRHWLWEVVEVGHHAVLTPELRTEWNAHQSRIALLWRVRMKDRELLEERRMPVRPELREALEALSVDEGQRVGLKDVHLLEAAFAADHTVVSCETRAAKVFCKVLDRVNGLGEMLWVDPASDDKTPILWLNEGAPPREEWHLQRLKEQFDAKPWE